MESPTRSTNAELMRRARQSLSGHWRHAIVAMANYLVMNLLLSYLSLVPLIGWLLMLLLSAPLQLGLARYMLARARGETLPVPAVWYAFQSGQRYWLALRTDLLMQLWIVLWALLLLIPGIIALLGYSMTFFLLVEQPELGARGALRQSKALMRGNKWKYFCLNCRFIGWGILCLLPMIFAMDRLIGVVPDAHTLLYLLPLLQLFGIGYLWLGPYWLTSQAHFYLDIVQQARVPYAEVQDAEGTVEAPPTAEND